MDDSLKIKLYSFTLDCTDPYGLAKFYAALLGWEIPYHDEDFACLGAPGAAQGRIPASHFKRIPPTGLRYGPTSPKRSSRWPTWTSPSTISKRR